MLIKQAWPPPWKSISRLIDDQVAPSDFGLAREANGLAVLSTVIDPSATLCPENRLLQPISGIVVFVEREQGRGDIVGTNRFGQIIDCAELYRIHRGGDIAVAGENDGARFRAGPSGTRAG